MLIAREGYVGSVQLGGLLGGSGGGRACGYKSKRWQPGGAGVAIFASAGVKVPDGLAEQRLAGDRTTGQARPSVAGDRVYVVGDAAGYVEPFTGEGVGHAISAAMGLSAVLLAGRRAGEPEPDLAALESRISSAGDRPAGALSRPVRRYAPSVDGGSGISRGGTLAGVAAGPGLAFEWPLDRDCDASSAASAAQVADGEFALRGAVLAPSDRDERDRSANHCQAANDFSLDFRFGGLAPTSVCGTVTQCRSGMMRKRRQNGGSGGSQFWPPGQKFCSPGKVLPQNGFRAAIGARRRDTFPSVAGSFFLSWRDLPWLEPSPPDPSGVLDCDRRSFGHSFAFGARRFEGSGAGGGETRKFVRGRRAIGVRAVAGGRAAGIGRRGLEMLETCGPHVHRVVRRMIGGQSRTEVRLARLRAVDLVVVFFESGQDGRIQQPRTVIAYLAAMCTTR